MRMFLIGMTDIFLILYLTSITNLQTNKSMLTVADFWKLKSIHESLKSEMQIKDETFQEKLRQSEEEKDKLAAKLTQEKDQLDKMQKSLTLNDAQLARINQDLATKEQMLKDREKLLANLNQQIGAKESTWQKIKASYQEELKNQEQTVEASRTMVEKLQHEAQNAQRLAEQMKKEADQAYQTADTAKAVQEKAIILKDEALKEKENAERKAREAQQARQKAEAAAAEAQKRKEQAEEKVEKLAMTIKDIKQAGDTAFTENIRPFLQKVTVTYENQIAERTFVYNRELNLLPININNQAIVIFPSQQIGFYRKSDKAPQALQISYNGQKFAHGWINKEADLIALVLPGYKSETFTPYPTDTNFAQLMPTLLAVRNNGNRSLGDKIRGLSDEYFIVNRDFLRPEQDYRLKYSVTGFRGTGQHGERIVNGDQLVALNGRLIGVANTANQIIRIDTLKGWKEITF